jgi:peptidoglycan/xylan/chitin deacetylase (PgdA/CDA1 family)
MKLKKAINAILICCIIQAFQTTAISQVAGEIANWQNNKKAAVSIQWDGWYWGHGNVAIPELLKRGMTGTFFVTTDTDDWMPVDWDMVKYAAENGIEIANHSSLHECTPSRWDFDLEVDSAKVRLERRTGKRVYTYAYACGAWNAEFAKRVEATGHVAARGVNWPGHIPTWDIPLNHFVFSYDFELEPGFGYYHTRG